MGQAMQGGEDTAGRRLWRHALAVLQGRPPPGGLPPHDPALAAAARRFVAATSPALADHLLGPAAGCDAGAVRRSRLLNRFARVGGARWAARLADDGIETVALKGLALAPTIYPDADLRAMSDADLLVRRRDLAAAIRSLGRHGLRFVPPRARSRWGFVSDASFLPMVSADGGANVDLYVQPDAWPLYRGLDVEAVMRSARPVEVDGISLLAPAEAHSLLVVASNAGRDLFGPTTVPKLLDAVLLAGRLTPAGLAEAAERAAAAGLAGPVSCLLALAGRLGARLPALPPALATPAGPIAGMEFERLIDDYAEVFRAPPGPLVRLRREWLLAAGPTVSIRRNLRRLAGLVRPHTGLPAEAGRDDAMDAKDGIHAA